MEAKGSSWNHVNKEPNYFLRVLVSIFIICN